MLPVYERVRDSAMLERVIVVPTTGRPVPPEYQPYAEFLQEGSSGYALPQLGEDEAAAMCYTSGTTGAPKGVLYSHRAIVLHSFCLSLRHQLRDTSVKVFELLPPWTDTELGGAHEGGEERGYRGAPPAEVAEGCFAAFAKDEFEIPVGQAKDLRDGSRKAPEKTFQMLNNRDE